MDGIAYNDRQMKDFLKIFIYTLPIFKIWKKIGWLNLTIPSLNKETIQLNCIQLDGTVTNEIEREPPFLIELTDQPPVEDLFCIR